MCIRDSPKTPKPLSRNLNCYQTHFIIKRFMGCTTSNKVAAVASPTQSAATLYHRGQSRERDKLECRVLRGFTRVLSGEEKGEGELKFCDVSVRRMNMSAHKRNGKLRSILKNSTKSTFARPESAHSDSKLHKNRKYNAVNIE
eukprot:TRINITY_DN2782_c0_g1_i1.p1 TRINITY_DN2782_c0_g1~~TRINITY_DN2782_c0_g1_i1.p1  ORF type:complete len:143 (-),score=18.28 TRINITY_DN2782_c0_g1_i1:121-549(-)